MADRNENGEVIKYKIGDVVKVTTTKVDGNEVYGIVYENGNRSGDFRVQVIGRHKVRGLEQSQLSPATIEDIKKTAKEAVKNFTPEKVRAEEVEQWGGLGEHEDNVKLDTGEGVTEETKDE
jgi:hypothetical protein